MKADLYVSGTVVYIRIHKMNNTEKSFFRSIHSRKRALKISEYLLPDEDSKDIDPIEVLLEEAG